MDRQDSHFAAFTAFRVRDKTPELLVINSQQPKKKSEEGPPFYSEARIQFAGGGSEGEESPYATVRREAIEELGDLGFDLLFANEVIRVPFGDHLKIFFLGDFRGQLRKSDKIESDGTLISAPYFEDVREMFWSKNFLWTHRLALDSYICRIAEINSVFRSAAVELELILKEGGRCVPRKVRA